MVRQLLHRPIGTCVVALTLSLLGIFAIKFLPVSLLPNIPVPEITVQVNYPNAPVRQIQQLVATPLKNQLLQLGNLSDLEAVCNDGQAIIKLRFNYGTDIDLSYIETNEKIDMLMESLPNDISRPKVIKAGVADVAAFYINVRYKNDSTDFLELSNFCENVLKRRLEQLTEIAFVDMTGLSKAEVLIQPDMVSLAHAGISVESLISLVKQQSGEQGNMVVKDGPYEYSISFDATLRKPSDIENLLLKLPGVNSRIIRLGDFCNVSIREQQGNGFYSFNGKRAIALAVIKQNDAQLLQLRENMESTLEIFEKEYPRLQFQISQDQSELLTLSIGNLVNSLISGAILSFIMILFFMRDKRLVLLVGIVIPLSLSITLLGFYVAGISINIVSLAGLVLGIGEIVDSAIIIIESIEQHLETQTDGKEISLEDACILGSEEVIRPLFTSVLTNSVVFLPLLFLSGIAGAIFFDQALAVTLALVVSLSTSYTIIPVIYYHIFKNRNYTKKEQTIAVRISHSIYDRTFDYAINNPGFMISCWLILILASVFVMQNLKKEGMPQVSRTDIETIIDWNEPISPEESSTRLNKLFKDISIPSTETGLFVGQQQFMLNSKFQQTVTQASIITKLNDSNLFDSLKITISRRIQAKYPMAIFETRPAPNIFEQLFQTSEAPLKLLVSGHMAQAAPSLETIDSLRTLLFKNNIVVQRPPIRERIKLLIQSEKLILYNVSEQHLVQTLRSTFNDNKIGTLRPDEKQIPIILGNLSNLTGIQNVINNTLISNNSGSLIPIKELVEYEKVLDYASIHIGRDAVYIPLEPSGGFEDIPDLQERIKTIFQSFPDLSLQFSGSYLRNLSYLKNLNLTVVIAIGMLFFILAAQFESLTQPFIVILTIIFGCTGALISLFLAGNTLNIMSVIGLIVLIGLLDNDSILKLDVMNRSREKLSLLDSIKLGGQSRLQSQIMTFLTTQLGLLPILWSSGLGAELQKPIAITVMGGMFIGLLISWTFIPLVYYWIYRKVLIKF